MPLERMREAERIRTVRSLSLPQLRRATSFGHIVRVAAQHFRVPLAFISLVDEDHVWLAASHGLDVDTLHRPETFCDRAIRSDDIAVIEDTHLDRDFARSRFVLGEPHIRFYAGAPIVLEGFHRVGNLCIADRRPRTLNLGQRIMMRNLAGIAADEMRLLRGRNEASGHSVLIRPASGTFGHGLH